MAANDAIIGFGTELILAATGTTSALSDGGLAECTDDDRQAADDAGYYLGIFEFKCAAAGFSAAPTAGAYIHIYEQKLHPDGDSPDPVDVDYPGDLVASIPVKDADEQQHLVSDVVHIAPGGAKYWVNWEDGGSGTASISAGWELVLQPVAITPASS